MGAFTLTFNKNVETKKMLIGIAKFIAINSEAAFLSQGTDILTTTQEIRATKKAQVLLPLLSGILDVKEVLSQAKAGGVELTEADLNEFIVTLANEKVTKPQIFRPRDGEVLTEAGADKIVGMYQNGYNITATVAKDRAFYASVVDGVKNGIPLAVGGAVLKGAIVDAALTGNTEDEKNKDLVSKLLNARTGIKKTKDRFVQGKIANKDIVFVINTEAETRIELNTAYNMYTEAAQSKLGLNLSVEATLSGSPVIVSKQLPAGVDFMVFYKGAATSIFAIRKYLNFDKIVGVQAYASSLEFDEGTGVWLPQLITIGSSDLNLLPVQTAVTFEALVLDMNTSKTVSGNAANDAGLEDGSAGNILTLAELNAMSVKQLDGFAKVEGIDMTGTTDKPSKVAAIKAETGL